MDRAGDQRRPAARRGGRRHPHRLAGGPRRRRPPALRRRLDRPRADRRARSPPCPATGRRTFGYQRSEVLAALVNGLLLVAVSVAIGWAAIGRLSDPPAIEGGGVLALGVLGLPATSPRPGSWPAASARTSTSRASCATASPTRSARSASSSPAPSSSLGGSDIVDPIVGLLISALVLASSWRLIKEPFDVLMEAAPADLDVDVMGAAICERAGGALGPRPPRLDRDRRLRRPLRPCRRRQGLRPRPDLSPASS